MFNLTCVKCSEKEISLDLDDCQTFRCRSCEEEYTVDDVREIIAEYSKVLAWIDTAPTFADAKPAKS